MRLHAQTAVIENGFVFVPERRPGSPTTSPSSRPSRGRHDDQVDFDRAGAKLGEDQATGDDARGLDSVLSTWRP